MKGTVKFFNRKKGFGFISGEDGQDYFVHVSALPQGTFLNDNDEVTFEGGPGERGLKAENVQVTKSSPAPERGSRHSAPSSENSDEEQ
ncbi:MAG: cold shock protein beta-ribbon, CspA family [archaeon GW2011_AR9]|nr:MAG: cold shock protein beta-ribbon, CspA family [archaeon GW2011_AR9]MBS3120563.1 cold shock domain-containing protein [Candidatus Woesearchaeota archaeon]HIG93170.1 cold shock domain-containing protein [Candidatus Woesearchaeota archaeon]HIH13487.1 cold shock domain-containing protein [Candidatus Woesearchaeota archaeon]